jgi:Cytochrome P460
MRGKHIPAIVTIAIVLVVSGGMSVTAQSKQDKYTVKVPNGLAFSEFKGYEDWQSVAVSHPEDKLNVIVANPVMIKAYQAGIPGNGKPFPDGAKLAKIAWNAKRSTEAPFPTKVSDTLSGVGFMVKDSKRFADSGGWGYAQFDYEPASDTFKPNTLLQKNDAKCGAACHTIAKAKDYVFTEYGRR